MATLNPCTHEQYEHVAETRYNAVFWCPDCGGLCGHFDESGEQWRLPRMAPDLAPPPQAPPSSDRTRSRVSDGER